MSNRLNRSHGPKGQPEGIREFLTCGRLLFGINGVASRDLDTGHRWRPETDGSPEPLQFMPEDWKNDRVIPCLPKRSARLTHAVPCSAIQLASGSTFLQGELDSSRAHIPPSGGSTPPSATSFTSQQPARRSKEMGNVTLAAAHQTSNGPRCEAFLRCRGSNGLGTCFLNRQPPSKRYYEGSNPSGIATFPQT